MFADESYFRLNRTAKKVFVLFDEPITTIEKVNPVSSVMVWGAISRRGALCLQFLSESVDGQNYLDLLQDNFAQIGNDADGEGRWRFMHDNAPAHTSTIVKEWISDNMPNVITQHHDLLISI